MEASCRLNAPAALPLEKNLGTHSLRSWVGHTVGLDILKDRKISCPCRDWNARSSGPSPTHYPSNCAIPAPRLDVQYRIIFRSLGCNCWILVQTVYNDIQWTLFHRVNKYSAHERAFFNASQKRAAKGTAPRIRFLLLDKQKNTSERYLLSYTTVLRQNTTKLLHRARCLNLCYRVTIPQLGGGGWRWGWGGACRKHGNSNVVTLHKHNTSNSRLHRLLCTLVCNFPAHSTADLGVGWREGWNKNSSGRESIYEVT